jgi:hypothetical protein
MNRRNFVSTALAAGAASLPASAQTSAKAADGKQEFLEFRLYQTMLGDKKKPLQDYLSSAFIPAVNRLGIKSVGIFNVTHGPNRPSLYVLIPHPNMESVLTLGSRLDKDAEYQKNAASFMDLPLSDPGYVRKETSLMLAFSHLPKLVVPTQVAQKKSHIFQLRIYESHNEKIAKKKIEMFNEGGEIAIFQKTGLTPVFFGETLFGPLMPNLHYMLVFDDMAAKDSAWAAFRNHPDWTALSKKPEYANTVSNVTDIILAPTAFSQI